MSELQNILNVLVADLYRAAAQQKPLIDIPIRIIDSPSLTHEVFRNPEIFIKKYPFLEKISPGRFSTNGVEWEKRAKLTQSFYQQSTHAVSDEQISNIYSHHLSGDGLKSNGSFKAALIQSAIEVISLSYGLSQSIPWDKEMIDRLAITLREEQIISCLYPASEASIPNADLQNEYALLTSFWQRSTEFSQFLDRLSISAKNIPDFQPAGELIQNLFAASETMASAILWAVELMGRNIDVQNVLRDADDGVLLDLFCSEVLRLYPPVPFVTREVTEPCSFENIFFQKGEQLIVSIVGVLCHRDYWIDAMTFQLPRAEFVHDNYQNIAYIPFLSGPRVCGGMKLAKREFKLALQVILNSLRVNEITTPLSIEYGLTSRPSTQIDQYLDRIVS